MKKELIFASRNEALQYLSDMTGKKIKIAEEIDGESSINNMSKQKAKTYINKLTEKITKGFFTDDSWKPIHELFRVFNKENISYQIEKTEYQKDENGNPIRKIWLFTITFVNNKSKVQTLNGIITASGAGSVKDPLDRYDVTAYVN